MNILDGIEIKHKKDKTITIRVNEVTKKRIESITKKFNISQSDLIEHLIEKANKDLKKKKTK